MFFFFKQKTAYEMRISDWSSDVCSSDLEDRDGFRARVRAWLDEHAPAKGSPDDFSNVHVVSASTIEEYEAGERRALEVTRAWQRKLHEAGFAGRSWPVEYGGHGAPAWQDDVIAEEQARYGVSTKLFAVALDSSEEHTSELQSLMRI